jgi:hypothetical protein
MPILLIFILPFSGPDAFSQAGQQNQITFSAAGGFQTNLEVFDKNGQPFANPTEDVSGSPFFLPAWTSGMIRLRDSTGYTNIQLRLNLLSQEVHYQDRNKVEMALPKGFILEVVLKDSASPHGPQLYTFRCGYPPVDNQDQNNLYRVLASGKLTLLESVRKVVVTQKNEVSGEMQKEFHEYDDYYIYQNGAVHRLKRDKASILSLMADQQDKVSAFVESNKTSFKSIEDIGRLIVYYNELNKP